MPYKTVWTAWTNNDNPIYNGGEFEFKYLVASSKGFCKYVYLSFSHFPDFLS